MSEVSEQGQPRSRDSRMSRAEALAYFACAISFVTLLLFLLTRTSGDTASSSQPSNEIAVPPPDLTPDKLSLEDLSSALSTVAEKARKSVVRIEVSFKTGPKPPDELETYFGNVPQPQMGSGVVVDSSGLIVTNFHVVRNAESLAITTHDGRHLDAALVGHDDLTDLALLSVPQLGLPAMTWGKSEQVATGQLAMAIGNPYGLDQTVTLGIISSTNRPTLLDSPFQDFLQTDASINPGNSGGALVDVQGRLIGINTAIAGESFQGISFALPARFAEEVVQQLRTNGEVPRGWIGVQLGSVTRARAALAGLRRPTGAYVESIVADPESPASVAGLLAGDICVRFENREVTGPLGLMRQIASHPIQSQAKLTIVRNGGETDIMVAILRRP